VSPQPTVSTPSTLPEYLSFVSVLDLVEKPLFGGYRVRSLPFVVQGLLVFSEGIVLGRTYRDRLQVLVQMMLGSLTFGETFRRLGLSSRMAKDSSSILTYLSKVAGDAIQHYGREPDSLLDFLLTSLSPPELDIRDIQTMKQLRTRKVPIEGVLYQGGSWAVAGISLGATFPELAGKLLTMPYGTRDPLWWAEIRRAGLAPPEPEMFSPEMWGQLAVSILSVFTEQHHPHLLEPLGLAH